MVYVVEEMDYILLSHEACKDLGIIGSDFPTIGSYGDNEVLKLSVDDEICQDDCELPTPCKIDSNENCFCLRRELPPPPPVYPPGKPVHELKMLILRYYAASTFNRCT